jgi:hypothetical protein
MSQDFQPGDFLIFQLESGYGLLRLLSIDEQNGERVWHVAAYEDLFLDTEGAEAAISDPEQLSLTNPHIALTNRAFESTQVARMGNVPLTPEEERRARDASAQPKVSDRSIRLLLGLR